jgi:TM2 domain-containing membrane protein YozV
MKKGYLLSQIVMGVLLLVVFVWVTFIRNQTLMHYYDATEINLNLETCTCENEYELKKLSTISKENSLSILKSSIHLRTFVLCFTIAFWIILFIDQVVAWRVRKIRSQEP